jgi:hypothetical protein
MGRGPLVTLLAFSVFALLLAGCGGGGTDTSGSDSGSSGTIAKAAFVKKANALCEQSEKQRTQRLKAANKWVKGNGPNKPTKEKIARYVVVTPVEILVHELRALGEVEGDAALSEYADLLEEDVKSAKAEPLTAYLGAAFEDSDHVATRSGLSSCTL